MTLEENIWGKPFASRLTLGSFHPDISRGTLFFKFQMKLLTPPTPVDTYTHTDTDTDTHPVPVWSKPSIPPHLSKAGSTHQDLQVKSALIPVFR